MNVLYLGMSGDIITPLLLFPDVITLYAINKISKRHSYNKDKTWEEYKDDMKRILLEGNDKNSWYYHNGYNESRKESNNIILLKTPCQIISESDDIERRIWTLQFIYNGLPRFLIYYYECDFMHEWPKNIININRLLIINTPFMEVLVDNEKDDYLKMIQPHLSYSLNFWYATSRILYSFLKPTYKLKISDDYIRKFVIITIENPDKLKLIDFIPQTPRQKASLRLMRNEIPDEKVHKDKMCRIITPRTLQNQKKRLKHIIPQTNIIKYMYSKENNILDNNKIMLDLLL